MTPPPNPARSRAPNPLRAALPCLAALVLASISAAAPAALASTPPAPEPFSSYFDDVYLEALDVLAVEDEVARLAVLEASLYPETVAEIRGVQLQSSTSFRELIAGLSPYDQARIWGLTRYPALVEELVIGGPRPDVEQLERQAQALAEIPEETRDEVRAIASWVLHTNFKLLEQVWAVHADAEYAYHEVLSTHREETQHAFRVLIEQPELMNTLVLNPDLVTKLGELYRENPDRTREDFALYAAEHDQRNNLRLAQWQEVLVEDPVAREELRESALEFAREQGLPSPDVPVEAVPYERQVEVVYASPAPAFWWGSSAFMAGVLSGAASHHSHWGFHFNDSGGMVVFGVPSREFRRWHTHRRGHRSYGGYSFRWSGSRPYARHSNRWHGGKGKRRDHSQVRSQKGREGRQKAKAKAKRRERKQRQRDGAVTQRHDRSRRNGSVRAGLSLNKRSAHNRSVRQRGNTRSNRPRRGVDRVFGRRR